MSTPLQLDEEPIGSILAASVSLPLPVKTPALAALQIAASDSTHDMASMLKADSFAPPRLNWRRGYSSIEAAIPVAAAGGVGVGVGATHATMDRFVQAWKAGASSTSAAAPSPQDEDDDVDMRDFVVEDEDEDEELEYARAEAAFDDELDRHAAKRIKLQAKTASSSKKKKKPTSAQMRPQSSSAVAAAASSASSVPTSLSAGPSDFDFDFDASNRESDQTYVIARLIDKLEAMFRQLETTQYQQRPRIDWHSPTPVASPSVAASSSPLSFLVTSSSSNISANATLPAKEVEEIDSLITGLLKDPWAIMKHVQLPSDSISGCKLAYNASQPGYRSWDRTCTHAIRVVPVCRALHDYLQGGIGASINLTHFPQTEGHSHKEVAFFRATSENKLGEDSIYGTVASHVAIGPLLTWYSHNLCADTHPLRMYLVIKHEYTSEASYTVLVTYEEHSSKCIKDDKGDGWWEVPTTTGSVGHVVEFVAGQDFKLEESHPAPAIPHVSTTTPAPEHSYFQFRPPRSDGPEAFLKLAFEFPSAVLPGKVVASTSSTSAPPGKGTQSMATAPAQRFPLDFFTVGFVNKSPHGVVAFPDDNSRMSGDAMLAILIAADLFGIKLPASLVPFQINAAAMKKLGLDTDALVDARIKQLVMSALGGPNARTPKAVNGHSWSTTSLFTFLRLVALHAQQKSTAKVPMMDKLLGATPPTPSRMAWLVPHEKLIAWKTVSDVAKQLDKDLGQALNQIECFDSATYDQLAPALKKYCWLVSQFAPQVKSKLVWEQLLCTLVNVPLEMGERRQEEAWPRRDTLYHQMRELRKELTVQLMVHDKQNKALRKVNAALLASAKSDLKRNRAHDEADDEAEAGEKSRVSIEQEHDAVTMWSRPFEADPRGPAAAAAAAALQFDHRHLTALFYPHAPGAPSPTTQPTHAATVAHRQMILHQQQQAAAAAHYHQYAKPSRKRAAAAALGGSSSSSLSTATASPASVSLAAPSSTGLVTGSSGQQYLVRSVANPKLTVADVATAHSVSSYGRSTPPIGELCDTVRSANLTPSASATSVLTSFPMLQVPTDSAPAAARPIRGMNREVRAWLSANDADATPEVRLSASQVLADQELSLRAAMGPFDASMSDLIDLKFKLSTPTLFTSLQRMYPSIQRAVPYLARDCPFLFQVDGSNLYSAHEVPISPELRSAALTRVIVAVSARVEADLEWLKNPMDPRLVPAELRPDLAQLLFLPVRLHEDKWPVEIQDLSASHSVCSSSPAHRNGRASPALVLMSSSLPSSGPSSLLTAFHGSHFDAPMEIFAGAGPPEYGADAIREQAVATERAETERLRAELSSAQAQLAAQMVWTCARCTEKIIKATQPKACCECGHSWMGTCSSTNNSTEQQHKGDDTVWMEGTGSLHGVYSMQKPVTGAATESALAGASSASAAEVRPPRSKAEELEWSLALQMQQLQEELIRLDLLPSASTQPPPAATVSVLKAAEETGKARAVRFAAVYFQDSSAALASFSSLSRRLKAGLKDAWTGVVGARNGASLSYVYVKERTIEVAVGGVEHKDRDMDAVAREIALELAAATNRVLDAALAASAPLATVIAQAWDFEVLVRRAQTLILEQSGPCSDSAAVHGEAARCTLASAAHDRAAPTTFGTVSLFLSAPVRSSSPPKHYLLTCFHTSVLCAPLRRHSPEVASDEDAERQQQQERYDRYREFTHATDAEKKKLLKEGTLLLRVAPHTRAALPPADSSSSSSSSSRPPCSCNSCLCRVSHATAALPVVPVQPSSCLVVYHPLGRDLCLTEICHSVWASINVDLRLVKRQEPSAPWTVSSFNGQYQLIVNAINEINILHTDNTFEHLMCITECLAQLRSPEEQEAVSAVMCATKSADISLRLRQVLIMQLTHHSGTLDQYHASRLARFGTLWGTLLDRHNLAIVRYDLSCGRTSFGYLTAARMAVESLQQQWLILPFSRRVAPDDHANMCAMGDSGALVRWHTFALNKDSPAFVKHDHIASALAGSFPLAVHRGIQFEGEGMIATPMDQVVSWVCQELRLSGNDQLDLRC